MMTRILIFIILFSITRSKAQYISFYGGRIISKDTIIKDFDNDGFIDSAKANYDGGSGFGGTFVHIYDGQEKKYFSFNNDGGHWDSWGIVDADKEVFTVKNKWVRKIARHWLLPNKRRVNPDGFLRWILDYNNSVQDADSASVFSQVFSFKPYWYSGPIDWGERYYLDYTPDKWYSINKDSPILTMFDPVEFDYGWIYVLPNMVTGRPAVVDTLGDLILHRSGNALIGQLGNQYLWLYAGVHACSKFSGIEDAWLDEGLLFIEFVWWASEQELCVIDLNTSRGGVLGSYLGSLTRKKNAIEFLFRNQEHQDVRHTLTYSQLRKHLKPLAGIN
ncbi:MAG: hypothetical protein MRY83_18125 [Flavobacteriales bacterium]|nr:hypothetical protein [Flavobacteriales bacterium]